ncbi:Retrovirus-related Pol polyprotein from transposon TNT 1-94 [Vitis vinifera]|uniref:Retrovirus-related Pol polyprotein from transposon TNT 1-94 n=1 Tax=Vitis vinifera TaxID=29760 RepID=A0A438K4R3_VITVI|nr:Retrovirus-related Pol polyprotein from transposon TNT 1-94 [Vitis vinifera]
MSDNDVWELVDLPKGYKPIGCKWVFKTKRENKGNVERYKARLVAKGYTQREGIDFTETFSPVSTKDSFRLVMALVAHFDLELHQMDVKTAFLNGDLSEKVYMSQPEGLKENGKENMVCRLKRSIYGLEQASRQCSDVNLLNDTKRILSANFDMKDLGEASFVLGIEIYRNRSRNLLGLSQRAYINRVLKRFNMQTCKAGDVPVVKGDKLSNEQCPKNDLEKDAMKVIPYASAIGSLMYAQVAAKKVMRYLQRMKDFMLVYRRVDNLKVVGYSDSDFGGCSDDYKSTSGYIFRLDGGAISWKSVKQSLIASSTMYAEFVACYGASSQAVWLRNLILELQVVDSIFRPIVIYCDNNAVVFYSKNNKISTSSKHMEIKYLTVKDLVKK